jgi:hypothetical protein
VEKQDDPVFAHYNRGVSAEVLITDAKPIRGPAGPSVHWNEQINTVGDGPGILVEGIREQSL